MAADAAAANCIPAAASSAGAWARLEVVKVEGKHLGDMLREPLPGSGHSSQSISGSESEYEYDSSADRASDAEVPSPSEVDPPGKFTSSSVSLKTRSNTPAPSR
ncbi:hypothetical protein B0H19DRAFT_1083944 [Mycena capillaripes]|nr:hypothetical protein B0H19DRAFT_1083944 [Mycena capillaripes]